MENKTCRRCALFDPKLCGYVKMGKIKEENKFLKNRTDFDKVHNCPDFKLDLDKIMWKE